LSTIFSIFFKAFSSIIDVFLEENLPPFSAASYIIPKHPIKVNNYFSYFKINVLKHYIEKSISNTICRKPIIFPLNCGHPAADTPYYFITIISKQTIIDVVPLPFVCFHSKSLYTGRCEAAYPALESYTNVALFTHS